MATWRTVLATIGVMLTLTFLALAFVIGLSERPLVDPLRPFAFGALPAYPAACALVALRGRPALLTDAALACLVVVPTSFSGVTLVMVVPAALFGIARMGIRTGEPWRRALPRLAISIVTPIAIFAAVVFETERRCVRSGMAMGCTSAAVTATGAFLAISACAFGAWAVTRLTSPI